MDMDRYSHFAVLQFVQPTISLDMNGLTELMAIPYIQYTFSRVKINSRVFFENLLKNGWVFKIQKF